MQIYVITNKESGKVYIGQHKRADLGKYLRLKLSQAAYEVKRVGKGGGSHLFKSMRKHPKDVWSIEPLVTGVETKAELNRLERLYIALFDTRNPDIGYNICRGGEGFTGKHTQVAKDKVSAANKKRWEQPGVKESFRAKMLGHDTSDETKGKIKEARARQDETVRTAGCRQWVENNREVASKRLSHAAKVMGGKAGSREAKQRAARASVEGGSIRKAIHTRWHTNRGIRNPSCGLCAPFMTLQSPDHGSTR